MIDGLDRSPITSTARNQIKHAIAPKEVIPDIKRLNVFTAQNTSDATQNSTDYSGNCTKMDVFYLQEVPRQQVKIVL